MLNDWDGEESWAYLNSRTEILAIAAHSRLQELGLLKSSLEDYIVTLHEVEYMNTYCNRISRKCIQPA